VIVGDVESVVVIPHHLADEVARDAAEQELLEIFVLQEIEQGRALPGTYPPNAETLARYREWRSRRDPAPK
jgi:regulator of RNase E activity RraA